MITLYYSPHTRAERPLWLLEELQVPYQIQRIDRSKQEHKQAEYLKIHPHGLLPALKDGETIIIESVAICAYLADKFIEKNLAPALQARAAYYQWLFYAVATFEPPIMRTHLHTNLLPEEKRRSDSLIHAKQEFNLCAKILTHALENKQYLIENDFTTVDIIMGSLLIFARYLRMLDDEFPSLLDYVKRLTDRPAYKRMRAI